MRPAFPTLSSHTRQSVLRGASLKRLARTATVIVAAVLFAVLFANPGAGRESSAAAISDGVANGQFREGGEQPEGWTLSGEDGAWVQRDILELRGRADSAAAWMTRRHIIAPGGLYRLQFSARRLEGSGGCIVSGPADVNRDYHDIGSQWQTFSHVFRAGDSSPRDVPLRLGYWQAAGTIQFDWVKLAPVVPVYQRTAVGPLGGDEAVRDGKYVFQTQFGGQGTNHHRVLFRATAGFNTNRWTFGTGEVIYRFQLPDRKFTAAKAQFEVGYHQRGTIAAECSADGRRWTRLAAISGLGVAEGVLPADLLPAEAVYLRVSAEGESPSAQVFQIRFEAELDRPTEDAEGRTWYAAWHGETDPPAVLESLDCQGSSAGARSLHGVVRASDAGLRSVNLAISVRDPRGQKIGPARLEAFFDATGRASFDVPLSLELPGSHLAEIRIAAGDRTLGTLELEVPIPEFERADYGEMVAETEAASVWWCEAGWKVPRDRPLPASPGGEFAEVRLEAAKGDHEAVQVVLRPHRDLNEMRAEVSDFQGPDGAVIPAACVEVLQVYYHFVHSPTDATGVRDWWPDALPPMASSVALTAGRNQPLWILVHVPNAAAAGKYRGTLRMTAEGWKLDVPIRLQVWNFALPERNHIETAFGFSPDTAFRYHNVTGEADRRQVLDLYYRNFAQHRISPYDPVPLDHFSVRFEPEADPPRAILDFSRFDPAMARAVEEYRFTGIRLPIQGMGGGTFHARYEPSLAGLGEDSPKYQAMFADQVRQLEQHLREKGWLDMAYVYWFDEPDPKDYEFVRNGMERLKKYAPGLRRMLTEEPVKELFGAVDLWCPVTPNYNHEIAKSRRAAGERFWWYVCTGPKAPYCTLFIDHPATELRVWLWQTWQRKVEGILVWESNYWTSSAAFPEGFQDPYEDPMGYVSGYSTPKGVKRHWGNGDGRFVYPPLAARVPGRNNGEPILEPPVSSIRWEMLREGIEDYEMLYLLRELLRDRGHRLPAERRAELQALLEVPPEITREMTVFTTDPRPILARRAAIAEAIESLSALPGDGAIDR
ncbi:MAG: glycoside hydrolase domain-containing protein [Thermogutta sp.]